METDVAFHECNPNEYLTKEEHDRLCVTKFESIMDWAKLALEHSKEDRQRLWEKTTLLEGSLTKMNEKNDEFVKRIGGYFIKGLIAIVCVMLFQVFILPKVTRNGTDSMLMAIDSKQSRQYKISETNNQNMKIIMDKFGLPYKSPEGNGQ